MAMNEIAFAKTLEQLKDTARLQENMLTKEQIGEAFSQMQLTEEQLALIYEYLEKNSIGIDKPAEPENNLSGEDVDFLDM